MKPLYLSVVALTLVGCWLFWVSSVTAAVAEPPDTVTLDSLQELYEEVSFEHAMHQDLASCSCCHHHTTGDEPVDPLCLRCHRHPEPAVQLSCGSCHPQNWQVVVDGTGDEPASSAYHIDIPGLKGALHMRCLGCHREKGGPVGCQDCHAFTAVGKRRFDPAGSQVDGQGITAGGGQ